MPYALAALPLSISMLSRLMGGMDQVGTPWHVSSTEDLEELSFWLDCMKSNGIDFEVVVREDTSSLTNDRLIGRIRRLGITSVRILPPRHFQRGEILTIKFRSSRPATKSSSRPRASAQVSFLIAVCAITLYISAKEGQ